jgi:chemotaxis protein CheX
MSEQTKSVLDVNFINPFINGALETFKVQCKTECKPLKPILKANFSNHEELDIAGVIGINSPQFQGSIAICFSKATFLNIMSKMLDESYTELNSELEDGAGELINIIFGQAKKKLNESGYVIDRALPVVIRGNGTHLKAVSKNENPISIILPFESSSGPFYIEIDVANPD